MFGFVDNFLLYCASKCVSFIELERKPEKSLRSKFVLRWLGY